MENLKHTKGNWNIDSHSKGNNWFNISSEKGIIVRTFYGEAEPIVYESEAEANAKLIAAAPELLDALIKIKKLIAFNQDSELGLIINNAINKATK